MAIESVSLFAINIELAFQLLITHLCMKFSVM